MGNEHKSSADALAAILGPGGNATSAIEPSGETNATPETSDIANDDLSSDGAEATLEVVDDFVEPTPLASRQKRRARGAPKLTTTGGRSTRIVGLACLLGGIATTVLDGQGRLPASLSAWGYDSSILLAIGTVAYVIGVMRRQVALSQVRIDALSFQQQEAQLDMQANLQYLVEQQQIHAEKPPAQGEELERVLVALQRQDEKVNNLSRALKMYGKPLMEIANQGADVAAQVNQLKGHIEALLGAMQQGFTRVETAARSHAVDLGPLEERTMQTAEELRRGLQSIGERLPNAQAQQQLQQQLVRVEAGIQAMSQRFDDSEVRKSLVRLEDTTKVHSKKFDELARTDAVHAETQRLERQLDGAIAKLSTTVEQVRSKNLGGLETSVRDIQRELSSLATSVAYIQQAVKSGARVTAAAPTGQTPPPAASPATVTATAPAPTPTLARSNASEPTAPPAKTTPTAPTAAVDTTGLNDAQAGVAQNQTGSRASTSKNVLGAIAKLKKLKG